MENRLKGVINVIREVKDKWERVVDYIIREIIDK